jgi:aminoglycoside/choline kinase family phosphotransferase
MEHLLQLDKLYIAWKNNSPNRIDPLNISSASPRLYFRIFDNNETYIGVYNDDIKENNAFFHFSDTFLKARINIPELHLVSKNQAYYIIEDLGDINLLDILKREGETENLKQLYKKAIGQLIKMQLYGNDHIDFESFSYTRAKFDKQSLLWDLNYFKYYFLKVSGITFDEQLLENDFQNLSKEVEKQQWNAFMFRDFQARNIQIKNNEAWFIDYQGGRKGPMLYDLASLLFQASAQLSSSFKEEMKHYYKQELKKNFDVNDKIFEQDFVSIVFIRIIQTLGTYGFRGLIEKKPYFINSIPMALENLENLIQSQHFKLEIPYFISILRHLYQLKITFVSK